MTTLISQEISARDEESSETSVHHGPQSEQNLTFHVEAEEAHNGLCCILCKKDNALERELESEGENKKNYFLSKFIGSTKQLSD